jgi:MFS superfamily sulfate permease-like transporter
MVGLARGLIPSSYRREWLAKDVVAGIVLSTLLVPQGMAYAELAGLPPITAEPITDVDTTASDVLEELDEALNEHGISLVFAESENASRRVMGSRRTSAPAAWTGAVLLVGVLPRFRAIGQRIASSCRVRL